MSAETIPLPGWVVVLRRWWARLALPLDRSVPVARACAPVVYDVDQDGLGLPPGGGGGLVALADAAGVLVFRCLGDVPGGLGARGE